jgi:hypothetical protein
MKVSIDGKVVSITKEGYLEKTNTTIFVSPFLNPLKDSQIQHLNLTHPQLLRWYMIDEIRGHIVFERFYN